MVDELTRYHLVTVDVEVFKTQWEEFYISKFLVGSLPSLQSIMSHILAGDGSIPSLSNVYSHLLCVTIELATVFEPSGKDSSALVTSTGHQEAFRGRSIFPQFHRGGLGGRGFSPFNSSFSGYRGRGGRGRGFGRGRWRLGFFIAPIAGVIITQLIDVMIFMASLGRLRLIRLYSPLILLQVLLLIRKLVLPLPQLLHLLVSLSLCLARSTMP